MITASFPQVPVFDAYMNFPHGAYIIWPPLYDFCLAVAWGILAICPGGTHPPWALPHLPPLLFFLTACVVYRIGLRFWPKNRPYAFLAALAPAVLPIVIHYSYVGQLDHHAAELLCVALFTAGLFRSLPTLQQGKTFQRNWIYPGIFFGLGLLVQHGLLLLEAVLILPMLLFMGKHFRPQVWAFGCTVNTVAFLVTLPFGLSCYLRGVPLSHTHFGLFQPTVLLVLSLIFFTFWFASISHLKISRPVKYTTCTLTAVLAVMLTLYLLHHILAGTTYLLRTWTGWQAQIAESHSLLRISWNRAFDELSQYMSWAIALLPLAWLIMMYRWPRLSVHEKILFLSTLILAAFGLFQVRYLPYLALLFGLMLVFLINFMWKIFPLKRIIIPLFAAVFLVSYYPCTKSIGGQDITFEVYNEMEPILTWLKDRSPPDSLYANPRTSPEYGIVCDWNLGHYVQYYGHWPVLADNFGEHATDLSRLNRFFFSTKNNKAYQFLDENRVRYVLCQDLPSMYQSMILDKSMLAYVSEFDKQTGSIVFAPRMFPTVLYRLVWRYGGPFIDMENMVYYPPLDRLRLVAESRGRDETLSEPKVARIKLYEYVPGVRVDVTGLPLYTDVVLSTKVHTPHGRTFPYIQFFQSDADGRASLVLPYSNETEQPAYADEYRLIMGNRQKTLSSITEKMVLEGQTVQEIWE